MTEGTPTNGASPLDQEITPFTFGRGVGRSNFLFLQELQSLVVLINEDNKCNGLNENHCKRKEVFICNHFTTPFALTLGFLQGGKHPSAVGGVPSGSWTVYRIAYSDV